MTDWMKFLLLGIGICTLAGCGGRDNVVQESGPGALYETGAEPVKLQRPAILVSETRGEARRRAAHLTRFRPAH